MTKEEISQCYRIPLPILEEYERWGLRGTKTQAGPYDDTDLAHLGTILTLRDIGFTVREAEAYMRLLLEEDHTEARRLAMLAETRRAVLEEIHCKERQLQRLDYLRHAIRKEQGGTAP